MRIAIPCDWVTYQPRYKWIDAYRDAIPQLLSIDEKYDDLLSDKAKLIKKAAKEEILPRLFLYWHGKSRKKIFYERRCFSL